MSPTRKSGPPAKADTAHKPSRKVAIEEVLRSLQDLVNNELAVETPRPAAPPETAATATAPVPPEAGASVAEEIVAAPAESGGETENITLEGPVEFTPEPVAPISVPPGGLQQDLPYLDSPPEAPATTGTDGGALLVEPEVPMPELPGTDALDDTTRAAPALEADTGGLLVEPEFPVSELPGTEDLAVDSLPAPTDSGALLVEPEVPVPELPGTDTLETAPADAPPALIIDEDVDVSALPDLAVESTAPEPPAPELIPAEDGGLHDIPVLEDAVELADELELHASPAPTPQLPPAGGARRLAIQVAARLNVELRRQGQPGLSSDVITHLAHLLEEALAKGAANMENSPPEKH